MKAATCPKRALCTRLSAITGVLLFLLAAGPAGAATQNWIGSSATWDNTTTANWSGGAVPINGDMVYLTQAAAMDLVIGYTATNLTGTGLSQLYLYHTGAAKTTFTLDGTGIGADALPVTTYFSIGQWADGDVEFNLKDEATLSINGINAFRLGASGRTGTFTVNQTGGTFNNGVGGASLFYVGQGGTYNLSGTGVLNANRSLTIESGGTWNQTGGSATFWSGLTIAAGGSFGLSNGSFLFSQAGQSITLAQNATGTWSGGTLAGNNMGRFQLNGAGASWTMASGVITVNNSGGSSATKDSFVIVPSATVQGYGTIQDARFGVSSPATFDSSGRVIANGYGVDRDFNLSRFGSTLFVNTTDNSSINGTNGWFATNHGKLLLPTLTVTPVSGAATVFWGESATDADGIPDLVNSVKLAFTGLTAGGSVTGSLLAADRADANRSMPVNDPLDTGMYALIGAWNLTATGINFGTGSATLTFRYDDAWATQTATDMARLETDLKLLKFNGSSWDILTAGVTMDTSANWIAVSGVNSFSLYGIAMLPEPGTCMLGALATALLAARRRRPSATGDRGHRGQ